MSYPLLLEPRPVERVWGGQALLENFGRGKPGIRLGESWEVFGELPVVNGPWAGRSLDSLCDELGPRLLGEVTPEGGFPLLGKWLDCSDWLSVQVHPDDQLAKELTGDPRARGKSECWYVHRTTPQAKLVHGWLAEQEGPDIESRLVYREPRQGEFLVTPAGTVHALGPGLLIFEIQQSSDLTYRIYDWGRDRPLHPQEFQRCLQASTPPQPLDRGEVLGSLEVETPFFLVEKCQGPCAWSVAPHSFEWLTVLDSTAEVCSNGVTLVLKPGDSVVLPASLGPIEVATEAAWLRVRRP